MNKQELVAIVAEENNLPKVRAKQIVDSVFDNIIQAVARGDSFQLVGFGTFIAVKREASQARNPRTGEVVQIPATIAPKFAAGKAFKDAVAK